MSTENPMPIELHPALFWMCDFCGADNFIRSFEAVLPADEAAELVERYGDDVLDLRLRSMPQHVQCCKCGGVYFEFVMDE